MTKSETNMNKLRKFNVFNKEIEEFNDNYITLSARILIFIKNLTTKNDINKECNNTCGYEQPYGFVPEADCPIHDIKQE